MPSYIDEIKSDPTVKAGVDAAKKGFNAAGEALGDAANAVGKFSSGLQKDAQEEIAKAKKAIVAATKKRSGEPPVGSGGQAPIISTVTGDKKPSNLLDFTFGMPPGNFVSNHMIRNTMPTATIIPCEPQLSPGLNLFSLKPAWSQYRKMLKDHGFVLPEKSKLEVAFLADNFPTDSFTNEYGESFLDKFAQVASTGISDVTQVLGARSVGDIATMGGKLVDMVTGTGVGTAGANAAKNVASNTMAGLESMAAGGSDLANVAQTLVSTAGAVATGGRIDFPKVWKNSAFSPSYTMTVRLWNPSPGSSTLTRKYIHGPLTALLLLATPQAAKGEAAAYKWPFFCRVRAKGIWHLHMAAISSITVIKGGDQQNIGWNQALGIVDVRIDFVSLYNSILAEHNPGHLQRPALYDYIKTLGDDSGSNLRFTDNPVRVVEPEHPTLKDSARSVTDKATDKLLNKLKEKLIKSLPPAAQSTAREVIDRTGVEDKLKSAALKGVGEIFN